MCWRVLSYAFFVEKLHWPVRNRLTVRNATVLTCEKQTHSAKTNCPDTQGTDLWSEGRLYEWISLTHKEQTCGARDLIDEDYLMTVLTREDLTHGAKTYLDWEFSFWLRWPMRNWLMVRRLERMNWQMFVWAEKSELEWHSPASFQKFHLISVKSNILLS